jgi:hypothetical protein
MKDFITPDKWTLPMIWFLASAQVAEVGNDALKTKELFGFQNEILATTVGLMLGVGAVYWLIISIASLIYAIRNRTVS